MKSNEDEEEPKIEDDKKLITQSPALQYQLYSQNEDLVEKLKLLNYEKGYASVPGQRPISRHYFVTSSTVGEQFYLFTTLSAWLIQKAINPKFVKPQEFDDPNVIVSNILDELRRKEIVVDFAPSKLKSGYGEQCLYVLNNLADLALIADGFSWQRAEPVVENDDELDIGLDEAELTELQVVEGIIKSDVDIDAWKLEVEHVAPLLKVNIQPTDWRSHIEQMQHYRQAIDNFLNSAKPHLINISEDSAKSLQRITTREKHLNNQLDNSIEKFHINQDKMAELKEKYREASVGIVQRTQALQRICDDIDQIKEQIDEESHRSSDGAPILKIKQALIKLETDIATMNVQIGVIEHFLLQFQLKNRVAFSIHLLLNLFVPIFTSSL
ncbi:unnamed protein product [Dracunculus medinensis]|uniref:Intraflagellar transport protein 57 homolog n=1 Tax=Dracunculus medinensis TaxID=318479 RepID=A0A0N4UHV5_DRAME|nr:unnamed protein product [Dracunculus medinensis]